MTPFYNFSTPQLKKAHSGKVRESYHIDKQQRILIATDRLSCFDRILPSSFPGKGVYLTHMSARWFELTRHIVPNHFIKTLAPNISLVKEASPIPLEIIVRQFLTGSLWRAYEKGIRDISGVKLPDGMKKNQVFSKPIITPTTKEKVDRPISPDEILKSGLVDKDTYKEMEGAALKLFHFGQEYCSKQGLYLVDTKYEFGTIDGRLCLIDELHTPDSSRFWRKDASSIDATSSTEPQWLDKEFIRQWLLKNPSEDLTVAPEILSEAQKRYEEVCARLFEHNPLSENMCSLSNSVYDHLCSQNIIKKAYVAIVMGSKSDPEFAQNIRELLKPYDVMVEFRIASAHKNGERILELASEYNHSIEPGCVIAIAGRSNGLGGALAANLNIPVINCPPFKDANDIQLNIHSSLMMPSQAPALTAIYPEQAASAAIRALNLRELRIDISSEILAMKQKLFEDDHLARKRV